MEWRVEALNDTVRDELDALPVDMRARLIRIQLLIKQIGLEALREPHVKHVEGKLWEMRVKGRKVLHGPFTSPRWGEGWSSSAPS